MPKTSFLATRIVWIRQRFLLWIAKRIVFKFCLVNVQRWKLSSKMWIIWSIWSNPSVLSTTGNNLRLNKMSTSKTLWPRWETSKRIKQKLLKMSWDTNWLLLIWKSLMQTLSQSDPCEDLDPNAFEHFTYMYGIISLFLHTLKKIWLKFFKKLWWFGYCICLIENYNYI